jgi:hypothetical protein
VRPGEVGNAPVAARQVRQNLPARGIGQRGKSSVQRSRRIFNHLVNYLAESLRRANIFLQFAEACSRLVFRRIIDSQQTAASEIRSTPRLSLRGRTGFLFATSLEQFNLPCIETVVRCDDLYFPRLHARRDDRTGAL